MAPEMKHPRVATGGRKENLTHVHSRPPLPALSSPMVLLDPSLGSNERLVGLTLQVLASGGQVTATLAQLQEATALSRRSVQRALATLEERGHLLRSFAYPGGPVVYTPGGGVTGTPPLTSDTPQGVPQGHPLSPQTPPPGHTDTPPVSQGHPLSPGTPPSAQGDGAEHASGAAVLAFPGGQGQQAGPQSPPLPSPPDPLSHPSTPEQESLHGAETPTLPGEDGAPVVAFALIRGELVTYPLRRGASWTLPEALLERYRKRYGSRVDVEEELLKAQEWAVDTPGKRKTARGMSGFLTRWLQSAIREAEAEAAGHGARRRRRGPDMHVGGGTAIAAEVTTGTLTDLAQAIRQAARTYPAAAAIVEEAAAKVEALDLTKPAAVLQEALEGLELETLKAGWKVLDAATQAALEKSAKDSIPTNTTAELAERSRKTLLVRGVRETLGLPRFELAT